MVQILAATFKDGVFKPDEQPELSESSRVRLVVEPLETTDSSQTAKAWATLEEIWAEAKLDSGGDRLTRDGLHERR